MIVADAPWCAHELAPLRRNSFPYRPLWRNKFEYAARSFSWRAIDHAFQRITIWLGKRQRYHPDGFFNYEESLPVDAHPTTSSDPSAAPAPATLSGNFPIKALLEGEIKKLSDDVSIVIVIPPTFYTAIPLTLAAPRRRTLKPAKRLTDLLSPTGLFSSFLDYRIENTLTRDPANFVDLIHYRTKIARKMEERIGTSIRLGKSGRKLISSDASPLLLTSPDRGR